MYIMLPIMLAVRIGNDEDRKYLEKLYNETYRALVSYADSILQCREDSLDQVQALFLEMTGHIKTLRELHSPYCYLKKCLTRRIFNLINERAAKPCGAWTNLKRNMGLCRRDRSRRRGGRPERGLSASPRLRSKPETALPAVSSSCTIITG